MSLTLLVALVASLASVAAVWPQIGRMLRTSAPIQPPVCCAAFIAFALWTIYGGLLGSAAVVATNATCLVISTLILSARALFSAPR